MMSLACVLSAPQFLSNKADDCRTETETVFEDTEEETVSKVICETEFRDSCETKLELQCRNVTIGAEECETVESETVESETVEYETVEIGTLESETVKIAIVEIETVGRSAALSQAKRQSGARPFPNGSCWAIGNGSTSRSVQCHGPPVHLHAGGGLSALVWQ